MSADSPDLNAFAARLAALQPTTGLSRDQVMFQAGRRSAHRTTAWPLTSLALAGLALWFAMRPATVVESVQFVERIAQPPSLVRNEMGDCQSSYHHLRDTVLRFGIEALPQPSSDYESGPPLTPTDLNTFIR